MSTKGFGCVCIIDANGEIAGIITDGDLRRKMASANVMELTARDVMSVNPVTIANDTMAVEALAIMEQRKITSIVVVDAARRVEGVVHLHDLWRTEMV
ncbi:MAG: CBS domain-containing protein, partial [Acidobacteriota bacterium]|nr:CBS domain-containing protein [Acidobacteriota bacterium]